MSQSVAVAAVRVCPDVAASITSVLTLPIDALVRDGDLMVCSVQVARVLRGWQRKAFSVPFHRRAIFPSLSRLYRLMHIPFTVVPDSYAGSNVQKEAGPEHSCRVIIPAVRDRFAYRFVRLDAIQQRSCRVFVPTVDRLTVLSCHSLGTTEDVDL